MVNPHLWNSIYCNIFSFMQLSQFPWPKIALNNFQVNIIEHKCFQIEQVSSEKVKPIYCNKVQIIGSNSGGFPLICNIAKNLIYQNENFLGHS